MPPSTPISEDSAPILESRNLSVSNGDQRIVESLDLKVEAGESIGILAPNGVGTGTLLSHALIGRLGRRQVRKRIA